jgi:hypothetical protein
MPSRSSSGSGSRARMSSRQPGGPGPDGRGLLFVVSAPSGTGKTTSSRSWQRTPRCCPVLHVAPGGKASRRGDYHFMVAAFEGMIGRRVPRVGGRSGTCMARAAQTERPWRPRRHPRDRRPGGRAGPGAGPRALRTASRRSYSESARGTADAAGHRRRLTWRGGSDELPIRLLVINDSLRRRGVERSSLPSVRLRRRRPHYSDFSEASGVTEPE